jgi:hypothetical protein
MRGAIPPLPSTPSWRGAELKHMDYITLLYFTVNKNHFVLHNKISNGMFFHEIFYISNYEDKETLTALCISGWVSYLIIDLLRMISEQFLKTWSCFYINW